MAVILLSGGLDSSLNLALAARNGQADLAITIKYGQRAQANELKAAENLAKFYGVAWQSVDLSWLGKINKTGLTSHSQILPAPSFQQLDSQDSVDSMRAVWVANRNGIFLNVAAAFAESLNITEVVVGFNKEEAVTFPDNSQSFLDATNQALYFSTLNKVKINCFTTNLDKLQIMQKCIEIELPLNLVWSCYEGTENRCWKCESCKRSERALIACGSAGQNWLKKMGHTGV